MNHSNVIVRQFGVCDWHFTVQHVTTGTEVLAQPHHAVDIMTIESAAQGFGRRGVIVLPFPPAPQVGDSLTLVQTVNIKLVHRWAGRFDSDYLRSLVQFTRELKSVVNELQYEIFFWHRLVHCSDCFNRKWVDRPSLGVIVIPTNEDVLSRVDF